MTTRHTAAEVDAYRYGEAPRPGLSLEVTCGLGRGCDRQISCYPKEQIYECLERSAKSNPLHMVVLQREILPVPEGTVLEV